MKVLVQRVSRASVRVNDETVGSIGSGLLLYVGVEREDGPEDVDFMADKAAELRIFEDDAGKMNLSLLDTGGGALVISQFTLLASTRKGRRPSFSRAAPPGEAVPLYRRFVERLERRGVPVATGVFQAYMEVESVNAGPVTLFLDPRSLSRRSAR